MEKTTVLVLQKVQCKGYSNNLVPLTQAGADKEPSPPHRAPAKLHQNKLEPLDNSHCSCDSSHSSLKGESKKLASDPGLQWAFLSSKQKYPWTVFQLHQCLLKAEIYMKSSFRNFL